MIYEHKRRELRVQNGTHITKTDAKRLNKWLYYHNECTNFSVKRHEKYIYIKCLLVSRAV